MWQIQAGHPEKERELSDTAHGCCWVGQVGAAFVSEPGSGSIQHEN